VCARVEVTTHLTVRRHSTTNKTQPRQGKTEGTQRVTATIYDHRHKAHNTTLRHTGDAQ
jgi:hypothetical protein